MRVLVTGGTGFLGGHLIRDLSGSECQIIALARNMPQGAWPDNVVWCCNNDFQDRDWLSDVLGGIDVVIHAAAYAHQTRETSEEDKQIFQAVNVGLTDQLFSVSQEAGVKQFIYISSIGALTSFSSQIVTEEVDPCPENDYGESKLAAERVLLQKSESESTKITIIRPTLIYGRGNPGNMDRLSSLIDKRIPMPFKSVDAKRTFVYIGNLVSLIKACILNSNAYGEDFIAADSEVVTLEDIVVSLSKAKNVRIKLFYLPRGLWKLLGVFGDVASKMLRRSVGVDSYSVSRLIGSLVCSNVKARSVLGWQPPYTFQQGVRETFENE